MDVPLAATYPFSKEPAPAVTQDHYQFEKIYPIDGQTEDDRRKSRIRAASLEIHTAAHYENICSINRQLHINKSVIEREKDIGIVNAILPDAFRRDNQGRQILPGSVRAAADLRRLAQTAKRELGERRFGLFKSKLWAATGSGDPLHGFFHRHFATGELSEPKATEAKRELQKLLAQEKQQRQAEEQVAGQQAEQQQARQQREKQREERAEKPAEPQQQSQQQRDKQREEQAQPQREEQREERAEKQAEKQAEPQQQPQNGEEQPQNGEEQPQYGEEQQADGHGEEHEAQNSPVDDEDPILPLDDEPSQHFDNDNSDYTSLSDAGNESTMFDKSLSRDDTATFNTMFTGFPGSPADSRASFGSGQKMVGGGCSSPTRQCAAGDSAPPRFDDDEPEPSAGDRGTAISDDNGRSSAAENGFSFRSPRQPRQPRQPRRPRQARPPITKPKEAAEHIAKLAATRIKSSLCGQFGRARSMMQKDEAAALVDRVMRELSWRLQQEFIRAQDRDESPSRDTEDEDEDEPKRPGKRGRIPDEDKSFRAPQRKKACVRHEDEPRPTRRSARIAASLRPSGENAL